MTQIVWFKRDLRVTDHKPLADAAARGAVLPIYVFEPGYWARSDVSLRQQQFLVESLIDLDRDLTSLGVPLQVHVGPVIDVLAKLLSAAGRQGKPVALWSHEETGNLWTWQRDRTVAAFLRARAIEWRECRQHGVIRRLSSRTGWAARWNQLMALPITPVPALEAAVQAEAAELASAAPGTPNVVFATSTQLATAATEAQIDAALASKWRKIREHLSTACSVGDTTPCGNRQMGGRRQALALMHSFFQHRGHAYHREMSSPVTAEIACSRLSAHIALGCVSMREVVQCAWQNQSMLKSLPADQRSASTGTRAKAISAYVARLHWHCHFIQKLEDSPVHEVENVHRAFTGLRQEQGRSDYYHAWALGQTGFPFVDACMRSLRENGWINFRMRAMLMSFASFQLWLHWRQTGLHLARLFTDYEPGIHWNQVQMQSGTTGINTIRVYNPVKQSVDQDVDGEFIRRWVPELRLVPTCHVHQPWLMDELEQVNAQCIIGRDYPAPIVDHLQTAKTARQRLHAIRQSEGFAQEADRVQSRHGSRKSGIANTGSANNSVRRKKKPKAPVESRQQSLFFSE